MTDGVVPEQTALDFDRATSDSGTSDRAAGPDRGAMIGRGLLWLAKWSVAMVAIAAGAWVLGWLVGEFWVILLPVVLATIVTTVLWPATRTLRRFGVPPALASLAVMLLFFLILGGVIASIIPSIVAQAPDLVTRATQGVTQIQTWLEGPPINLRDDQIDTAIQQASQELQSRAQAIAGGVFSGVGAVGSTVVTLALVLVLVFFFLKDGPSFIPWVRAMSGARSGRHIAEVFERAWDTLGGFIRTQAIVSAIDAVFIGLGLILLGVPLAPVLITLTFLGGFIPIVGAFVAGALAVLVALVANGFTTALAVLAIIIIVQQVEGNVLQPLLQSRSMNLHAVVVLLGVTAGGSAFGIIGAFLAVPTIAIAAVVLRYINEQISRSATGEPDTVGAAVDPADLEPPADTDGDTAPADAAPAPGGDTKS
ncbi:AI-2E family transporter [Millisia brevis]|uniref:AI-2E family transporter n=1 Tax=Millisia brevis TaxID=264148 RepID=UPI000A06B8B9